MDMGMEMLFLGFLLWLKLLCFPKPRQWGTSLTYDEMVQTQGKMSN